MDFDKLKHWMEQAQKFQGKDFWNGVFGQDTIQTVFNDKPPNSGERNQMKPAQSPRIDIYQCATELMVLAEVPGADKEQIEITISPNSLSVSVLLPKVPEGWKTIQAERTAGAVTREIPLPAAVVESGARARFHHGLLEIRLPLQRKPTNTIKVE